MKEVLILRHAKSDWSTGESDFERPLNERGQNDAPRMGETIKKSKVVPDLIISSPAKRAKQTTNAVIKKSGFQGEVQWDDSFYYGNYENIIQTIQNVSNEHQRILIVGHNPKLENLVSAFASNGKLSLRLPTAALTLIVFDTSTWKEIDKGRGELEWILHPRLLKKMKL